MTNAFAKRWIHKNKSKTWQDYLDALEFKKKHFRMLWKFRHLQMANEKLKVLIQEIREFIWEKYKNHREQLILSKTE